MKTGVTLVWDERIALCVERISARPFQAQWNDSLGAVKMVLDLEWGRP